MSNIEGKISFELHPRQSLAFQTDATEVLYGGAAGGGKSFLARVAAIHSCTSIPNFQCYLFRRIFPDLVKNHMEGPQGFRVLLSEWVRSGYVEIVEDEIRFWNGSKIYLCHCQMEKDRYKYQGAEMHMLIVEEATQFTELIYRFLRSRVRAVGLNLPDETKHKYPRILLTSNPGNIGHHWVKSMFVDAVPMELRQMPEEEGGMVRQYIPAKLSDNPSMMRDDPKYEAKLSGLGNPAYVKAMRDGDWNVVAGSFFPEFGNQHIIEPFKIPKHWIKFRGFDWGFAKPFCCLWLAVCDGDMGGDKHTDSPIPEGSIVVYREWYGWNGSPDEGIRMSVKEVGQGILDREEEEIHYSIADPAIFKQDGGPSIAEELMKMGIVFRRGDNSREAGWNRVREMLRGEENRHGIKIPRLYIFNKCVHLIRTFPILQHDEMKMEDLDSSMEDHAVDTLRYSLMSRPYSNPIERREEKPIVGMEGLTFDRLLKEEKKRRLNRELWN